MDGLQLLLEGPFVICNDAGPNLCILVPDLMDSHFAPGFTATNNEYPLPNGTYTLQMDTGAPIDSLATGSSACKIDRFSWKRNADPNAYASLLVPRPSELRPISGTDAIIDGKGASYCTRAILWYSSVDLTTLRVPEADYDPEVDAFGGVGFLIFDMRPKQAADQDHDMMAYREMAKMVGIQRYMNFPSKTAMSVERGPHDDCRAALMLVDPT